MQPPEPDGAPVDFGRLVDVYDAESGGATIMSIPTLRNNTPESCPVSMEHRLEYLSHEEGDQFSADDLEWERTAKIGKSSYWVWRYMEGRERCHLVVLKKRVWLVIPRILVGCVGEFPELTLEEVLYHYFHPETMGMSPEREAEARSKHRKMMDGAEEKQKEQEARRREVLARPLEGDCPDTVGDVWRICRESDQPGARLTDAVQYAEHPCTIPAPFGHGSQGRRTSDLEVILPRKLADVVWTDSADLLVSPETAELFRASGLTGFEIKPVQAVDGREYCEIAITGWGGFAPEHSGCRLLEECPGCGGQTYSKFTDPALAVDAAQWDGSDFFYIWPLPLWHLVSDRAARWLREQNLTGIRLKPLAEASARTEGGRIETFSPGRLTDCMDEDRVQELLGRVRR